MQSKSQTLDHKLERPDWKQWMPISGVFAARKALSLGKPTVLDYGRGIARETYFLGYVLFQGSSLLATSYGLYQLAEKLL